MLTHLFFLIFYPPKLLESDERMSLLAVLLFDFQDRKFNTRELQGQQEVIHEVREMEEFLLRYWERKKTAQVQCGYK